MKTRISSVICLLTLLSCASLLFAQQPVPVKPEPPTSGGAPASADRTGKIVMKTSVGSFKMVSPGERSSHGKLEMDFRGTILVIGYKSNVPIQVTGKVRKEYENVQRERVLYNGTGHLVLDGSFRAIQWFGRDLNGKFDGMSIFRLYGEFDKDGKVGTYQVDGDVMRYWTPGGTTITVPRAVFGEPTKKPKIKIGN